MDRLEAIRNLSLRKTLILYIVCFLLGGIALSSLTINFADDEQNAIWKKYSDMIKTENTVGIAAENTEGIPTKDTIIISTEETVGKTTEDIVDKTTGGTEGIGIIYQYPRVSSSVLSTSDSAMVDFCDFLQTWSIFIISAGCVLGAVFLFYRNKLKTPLQLLEKSAKEIENNNLDFTIQYARRDELGQLCTSFEKMRKQLKYNNQKTWRIMEEQKRLNAAFAHDLRTPLTVLRGYSDLLTHYVPEGKISEDKLLSTISMMSRQINRLESYTDSMKQVTSLEELEVNYEKVSTVVLEQTITEAATILAEKVEKQVEVSTIKSIADSLQIDMGLILEVVENLLSNAVRYAKTTVYVVIAQEHDFFTVTVQDDGIGFQSEDLRSAVKPYYKDKSEDNSDHFGLGLYISSVLCEKHGGKLTLVNGDMGGASVKAEFRMLR